MSFFGFLLFFKVTEIPLPYHIDEVSIAYDASAIVKYHCDRFMYRFPVLFKSFGGAGQNALYPYLAVIMIRLFGYSILTVRLPAVLLSLLSALFFSLVIRREYDNKASILSMSFFCILPFSIMHSRWALESYLLFPMLILSCCALYHAIHNGNTVYYVLTGCLFGFTLYSYGVSYMLLPLFLLCILICLLVIKKMTWKNIFAMGIPLFFLALPLILMLAINYGFLDEIQTRFFSIPKVPEFRGGEVGKKFILDNLSFSRHNIFFSLFCDDGLVYNVIPKFGTMYYLSIPFIIYGFICCIKKSIQDLRTKQFSFSLMMVVLAFVVYAVSLIVILPNVNRLNPFYIPLIFFLVTGFYRIILNNKTAGAVAACLYLLCFCFFLYSYFVEFPKELESHQLITPINDLKKALLFAESVSKEDETIYVLDYPYNYIYTILALDIDPYTFNENKVLSYDGYMQAVGRYRFRKDAILPECVYIFTKQDVIPDNIDDYGFESEKFGQITVYFLPEKNQHILAF